MTPCHFQGMVIGHLYTDSNGELMYKSQRHPLVLQYKLGVLNQLLGFDFLPDQQPGMTYKERFGRS